MRIQGNLGSLLNNAYESHSTFSSWSSPWYDSTKQKKRILEKLTKIFLESLVFLERSKLKKEIQEREKLFTRESSQQAKDEMRNLFSFSFNTITKLEIKTKKKQERFFYYFLKVFQTHKKKARK